MSRESCRFESEARARVQGRAPSGIADGFEEHLGACRDCRDLVSIASSIADDWRRSVPTAVVPSSGLVWWRIQQRARAEAMRAASRAVTVVQTVSVAAGLAIAIGIAGAMSPAAGERGWFERLGDFVQSPLWNAATIAHLSLPLAVALATCLALAPVAVYLAVAKD